MFALINIAKNVLASRSARPSRDEAPRQEFSVLTWICLQASSLPVVELAALLHDVKDWKYSRDEAAGAEAVKVKSLCQCDQPATPRLMMPASLACTSRECTPANVPELGNCCTIRREGTRRVAHADGSRLIVERREALDWAAFKGAVELRYCLSYICRLADGLQPLIPTAVPSDQHYTTPARRLCSLLPITFALR